MENNLQPLIVNNEGKEITLAAWVTIEQVVLALKELRPVNEVEAERKHIEKKIHSAAFMLKQVILSKGPIDEKARSKRWDIRVLELEVGEKDGKWVFSSYGRKIPFTFKNSDILKNWESGRHLNQEHNFAIVVGGGIHMVWLTHLNVINAAMYHLENHGSYDRANPFQQAHGYIKSRSSRFPHSLLTQSFTLDLDNFRWNENQRENDIDRFIKLLNEIALQEGILQSKLNSAWGQTTM